MVDDPTMPPDDSSRRAFLSKAGLAGVAAAGLLTPWAAAQSAPGEASMAKVELFPGAVDANGQYVLPPLPYAYEALEPHIDAETMRLHHDKHHDGYVKGLIKAEEGLAKARESGDYAQVKALSRDASFNGGGHFLHCLFWANMAPESGKPSSDLAKAINDSFGSEDACRAHFSAAATAVEGSGWGAIMWSIPAKKLIIQQIQNQNLLSEWAAIPLLVVDVWEHAYYKKYGNLRGDYVKAFMNVVNWNDVSQRYDALRSKFG